MKTISCHCNNIPENVFFFGGNNHWNRLRTPLKETSVTLLNVKRVLAISRNLFFNRSLVLKLESRFFLSFLFSLIRAVKNLLPNLSRIRAGLQKSVSCCCTTQDRPDCLRILIRVPLFDGGHRKHIFGSNAFVSCVADSYAHERSFGLINYLVIISWGATMWNTADNLQVERKVQRCIDCLHPR